MKALNFLFNFLILTWLTNSCQSDGTEKGNLVKKLLRKRRSFLDIIPLRKQNLQNEWQDFQSKVNKLRRVKRQSWNFGQFLPCTNSLGQKSLTTNLVDCLGNFNLLWPIRWNFNPITAYDRLKSHYKGKGGWSEKEIQNFESLKNKMERIRAKENVKKRKHLGEQKLWRTRVLRKQKEWQDFQSKVNKLRQVERQS